MNSTAVPFHEFPRLSHVIETDGDIKVVIDTILVHAMEIMNSDFASLQMHSSKNRGSLSLLGHKNFKTDSARFWRTVYPGAGATCGEALRNMERIAVGDVRKMGFIQGSGDLLSFEHSGIRSVQSTPLICSNGELFGMISTHWRQPRDFDGDDFESFDRLASFTADFLFEHTYQVNQLLESDNIA